MSNHRDIPIEVVSRHEPVSETMKAYAIERASRLQRYHDRIARIQVVVDGVHGQPSMEMIVHVDSGATLVAREHHEHFRGGIDALTDKMERQLKKENEKRKSHKSESGKANLPGTQDAQTDEQPGRSM